MLDVLLAGLVTGYAIAVPVGPVAALIIALAARDGWRVGAAAGLGVAAVDGAYALLAVLAGTAVAAALGPIEHTLGVASTLALLTIAALTLLHAVRPANDGAGEAPGWSPLKAWVTFVGITAVNPATVIYFAAIVLGGSVDIDGPAEGTAFVVAAFLASASWQVFVAGLGTALGRRWGARGLAGPRGRRITGVLAAVVIAALAVRPLL